MTHSPSTHSPNAHARNTHSPEMGIPKLNTAYLVEQTYEVLKARILRRHFGANQKLMIPELAEQLGVSKAPVRDALSRLEMEGLVRTVPKVGTFVNGVDATSARETLDFRLMLDYWAADQLPGLGADRVQGIAAGLERAVLEAEGHIAANDETALIQADLDSRFHLTLLQLANNRRMIETYGSLLNTRNSNMGVRWITMDMYVMTWQQHRAILEALRGGNTEELKQRMKEHHGYSLGNLLRLLESNGGVL